MNTRQQARTARKLLRKMAYVPRDEFGTGALADRASESLASLESTLHEVGHLITFSEGIPGAMKLELPKHRMSIEKLLRLKPAARTSVEAERQKRYEDSNELEATAFTFVALEMLGHQVDSRDLINSARTSCKILGKYEVSEGIDKYIKSKKIRGWAHEFVKLLEQPQV